jgi:hypothetical protein
MGANRDERRAGRRALRPAVDERLESRLVLSVSQGAAEVAAAIAYVRQGRTAPAATPVRAPVARPAARPVTPAASPAPTPAGEIPQLRPIRTFVANGGRTVRIQDGRGDAFDVRISGGGTVTAVPMHDGRVRLIAIGTGPQSEMLINPVNPVPKKGGAHTFNPEFGVGDDILDVGGIDIRSGRIGSILGFRTANLSGPLVVRGTEVVDRIALNQILPGARIATGGDLNTLDVFGNARFSGADTGLFVGRDLNWFNVRGNLTLENGAVFDVGRDIGLAAQAAKGTGVGGQGGQIQGNLGISPGSAVLVGRRTDTAVVTQGSFIGDTATRILSPNGGWFALGPPITA